MTLPEKKIKEIHSLSNSKSIVCYEIESIDTREAAIVQRLKVIRMFLDEEKTVGCSSISVEVFNLIADLETK